MPEAKSGLQAAEYRSVGNERAKMLMAFGKRKAAVSAAPAEIATDRKAARAL